ncbi:MAG: glycosyltransferase family 4 protein [Nostocoides sp.]
MPVGHRVALVSSSYAPHVGGVETHVREVARELSAAGLAIEVWTVSRDGADRTAEIDGVTVRYLPAPLPRRSVAGLLSMMWHAPGAARSWWRAYRSFRPDMLHVQCFGPNGQYAYAMHRLLRIPLIVSSHGETFTDDHCVFDNSVLARRGLRAAIGGAVVTACSPLVAEELVNRFGARQVTVVPNGVTAQGALVRGRRPGAPIVAVGRLEWVKGFDILLRAYSMVSGTPGGLVIAGDGQEREALRGLARRLGIEDLVSFPGLLDAGDVATLLAGAYAAVVPSRKEAFGIIVLEAWAAGTPVIATLGTGPAAFVRDGIDGLLVPAQDEAALAAALERLVADPGFAGGLGAAGAARVGEFTWAATAREYLRLYDGLADRSGESVNPS